MSAILHLYKFVLYSIYVVIDVLSAGGNERAGICLFYRWNTVALNISWYRSSVRLVVFAHHNTAQLPLNKLCLTSYHAACVHLDCCYIATLTFEVIVLFTKGASTLEWGMYPQIYDATLRSFPNQTDGDDRSNWCNEINACGSF